MIVIEEIVRSPLPVDEVWLRMADFAHTAAWDPGVTGARKLDEGPVREGTRYAVDVRAGLSSTRMDYRVLVFDPPRRVVLAGVGWAFRALDDIRVTPDGDGARVVWHAELSLRGPLRLANAAMAKPFRRVADEAMAGLRGWLEAG